MVPDTTVFRVEGSRSLRMLSEYLSIRSDHHRAADSRQLLLALTSTPGNRRRGVRAYVHVFPPAAADLSAHTGAGARPRLEGVSHEPAFAATGVAQRHAASEV